MDETISSPEPIGRQRAIRVDVPTNLDNIRVILLEPREPGNIGSAARALKGMGLSQLYLVNPIPFLEAKPTWYMAHGATDVIENCCVVETLDDAVKGVQFLVGTTHRRRDPRLPPSVSAREAAQEIAAISQHQQVGLLFGREDFGLSTSQISRCQLIASVPMAAKNPSLNLAQAVQVFAYEVFLASADDIPPSELEYADVNEIEAFYGRITTLSTTDRCYALQSRLGDLFEVAAACVFADTVGAAGHRHLGHDFLDDTSLHHAAQPSAHRSVGYPFRRTLRRGRPQHLTLISSSSTITSYDLTRSRSSV